MKPALSHVLKFAGLLALMWVLTFVPFGIYVNLGLTAAGWWALTK